MVEMLKKTLVLLRFSSRRHDDARFAKKFFCDFQDEKKRSSHILIFCFLRASNIFNNAKKNNFVLKCISVLKQKNRIYRHL